MVSNLFVAIKRFFVFDFDVTSLQISRARKTILFDRVTIASLIIITSFTIYRFLFFNEFRISLPGLVWIVFISIVRSINKLFGIDLALKLLIYGMFPPIALAMYRTGGFNTAVFLFFLFLLVLSIYLLDFKYTIINFCIVVGLGFTVAYLQENDKLSQTGSNPSAYNLLAGQLFIMLMVISVIYFNSYITRQLEANIITERKEAEEVLKKSAELYQDLYENAPDMYVSVDPKTAIIIRCNQTLATNLGYEKEEIIGRKIFDMYHLDCLEYITTEVFPLIVKTGEIDDVELQLKKKDGSKIEVSLSVTSVRDEAGNTLYSRSAWRDISKIKETEKKLTNQTAELDFHSEILENMAEGVYLIRTSDSIIVYTNHVFENMFRYEPDELIGKHVSIVNAPSDQSPQDIAAIIIKELKQTGQWKGEILNRKKDGTRMWCHAVVTEYNHSEYGNVWISVHQDITKRKKAEEALKKSEILYQDLYENAPDMYASVDLTTGNITRPNKKIAMNLGFSKEEIMDLDIYDLHHQDSVDYLKTTLLPSLANTGKVQDAEVIMKRKDDRKIHTTLNVTSVRNETGMTVQSQFAWRDISNLRVITDRLKITNNELEELISIVAHDLKAPIRQISNFLQLINNELEEDITEEVKSFFSIIFNGTKRLTLMIDQVLDYSKITSRIRDTENYKEIEIKEVIENLIEFELADLIEDSKAEIHKSIEVQTLSGLSSDFHQLFQNLISNAIKFVKTGTKPVVKIKSVTNQDFYSIEIADNGIGVKKEETVKIFKMFYQSPTGDGSTNEGEGIGLSICKKIVQKYGGKIGFINNENGGSTFWVQIPL